MQKALIAFRIQHQKMLAFNDDKRQVAKKVTLNQLKDQY